jgi:hypothetical protein
MIVLAMLLDVTAALRGGVYADSDHTQVYRSLASAQGTFGHFVVSAQEEVDILTSASADVRASPFLDALQPFWRRVLRAFVLEGVAEAHCGAFTGTNYLLRLSHAGEAAPVYMSVLSVNSYTPDGAIWNQKLGAHRGQTLQLTIERAVFFRGDIMEGPFVQPQPYTVTVTP